MAKKKGKTLWEMLVDKLSHSQEFKYYNPLHTRVGHAVTIDTIELRDYNFFLREILEYKRRIGPNQYLFADYVILARPLEGEDVLLRLRLNPVDEKERTGDSSHHVLLLHLDEDMAYDEGLHKVVNDSTKKFQVIEDGKVVEEYFRINDVGRSYKAQVTRLRDIDQNGKVEKSEVEKLKLEYWDYWREIKDEAGQPKLQFLFVEMNSADGWFQIWKGEEMDPKKVLVI